MYILYKNIKDFFFNKYARLKKYIPAGIGAILCVATFSLPSGAAIPNCVSSTTVQGFFGSTYHAGEPWQDACGYATQPPLNENCNANDTCYKYFETCNTCAIGYVKKQTSEICSRWSGMADCGQGMEDLICQCGASDCGTVIYGECQSTCSCSCANNPTIECRAGSCSCSGSTPNYSTCTFTNASYGPTKSGSDSTGSYTETCSCS